MLELGSAPYLWLCHLCLWVRNHTWGLWREVKQSSRRSGGPWGVCSIPMLQHSPWESEETSNCLWRERGLRHLEKRTEHLSWKQQGQEDGKGAASQNPGLIFHLKVQGGVKFLCLCWPNLTTMGIPCRAAACSLPINLASISSSSSGKPGWNSRVSPGLPHL